MSNGEPKQISNDLFSVFLLKWRRSLISSTDQLLSGAAKVFFFSFSVSGRYGNERGPRVSTPTHHRSFSIEFCPAWIYLHFGGRKKGDNFFLFHIRAIRKNELDRKLCRRQSSLYHFVDWRGVGEKIRSSVVRTFDRWWAGGLDRVRARLWEGHVDQLLFCVCTYIRMWVCVWLAVGIWPLCVAALPVRSWRKMRGETVMLYTTLSFQAISPSGRRFFFPLSVSFVPEKEKLCQEWNYLATVVVVFVPQDQKQVSYQPNQIHN